MGKRTKRIYNKSKHADTKVVQDHPVSTLVIQSHRQPLPHSWLTPCIDSVKGWAKLNGFDYEFLGDQFFEILPQWILDKTLSQRVIATDIARLKWLQKYLSADYERVIWLDADFLIFAPEKFWLPDYGDLPENYALGREVWVQAKGGGKGPQENQIGTQTGTQTGIQTEVQIGPLFSTKTERFKVNTKVHNAFLLFGRGNAFLDFYAAHAERLLEKVTGTIPPQFVGPKLLTALHNVVQCPVQENAGMFSPWVIRDILNDGGPALDLFCAKSLQAPAGANLCSSLAGSLGLDDKMFDEVVARLLSRGGI